MGAHMKKLNKEQLNRLFIDGLGSAVEKVEDITAKPLLIDIRRPYPIKLRVYLYNCTNPPGGRALDEYKIQLIVPEQARGQRGTLDYSGGRLAILAAFARVSDRLDDGVFVLWDADKHVEFSYSANLQVKAETIIEALCLPVAQGTRSNNEIVLASRPKHLLSAIEMRIDIMTKDIQGDKL